MIDMTNGVTKEMSCEVLTSESSGDSDAAPSGPESQPLDTSAEVMELNRQAAAFKGGAEPA